MIISPRYRFSLTLAAAMLLPVAVQAAVPDFPVGAYPKFIISVDLNKDGKPDVITANYHDSSISILLGNGDGTFQPAVTYAVGAYPTGLAAGDFSGNGNIDLVVANAINPHQSSCPTCGLQGVSVLLGNGNGTFQPSIYYAAASGTAWVSAKDVNGDGKLDIIAAAWQANAVSVLLGNGDGTFQAPINTPVGDVPHSIAVGDLNGDKKPDLAVGNMYSNNVEILLGNGDGTFTAGASYPVGLVPHSICHGDFNGDGIIDLATANINSATMSVLIGNGDGTFQAAVNYNTEGVGPTSLYPADYNGDGITDIAVANSGSLSTGLATDGKGNTSAGASSIAIFIGNGDGTFKPAVTYSDGSGGNGVVGSALTPNGIEDLSICYFGSYVTVLLGKGNGTFKY